MNSIAKNIASFLLSNTVWIFVASILFSGNFVNLFADSQSWTMYLTTALKLGILYSPILLYMIVRGKNEVHFTPWLTAILWAFLFLGLQFIIKTKMVLSIFFDTSTTESFGTALIGASIAGYVILGSEIFYQISIFRHRNSFSIKWLDKIRLEPAIFVFMAFFSIFYLAIGWRQSFGTLTFSMIPSFVSATFQIFIILVIYYIFYWVNHYILVRHLWKVRGFFYYAIGFAATIIFLYPISAQLIYWLPIGHDTDIHPVNSGNVFEEMNWMVPLAGMTLSIPFILSINWFRQANELEKLAKEKSETELSLLKQQINPHFFFNTLNNLYALSITKDKQTPEVILQLSELMRYTIYKGKEESVKLSEEVKYIDDYIRLQQIRLHKKLDFKFEKNLEDDCIKIPPLLFINLVENAFKHGIEPAEKECFLHLSLQADERALVFTCKNSREGKVEEMEGVGLKNLRRRLELRFPERHELNVKKLSDSYSAVLKIHIHTTN